MTLAAVSAILSLTGSLVTRVIPETIPSGPPIFSALTKLPMTLLPKAPGLRLEGAIIAAETVRSLQRVLLYPQPALYTTRKRRGYTASVYPLGE